MVPVPYQPVDCATTATGTGTTTPPMQNVQEPVILREQVDEWIKMHPHPSTSP